MSYGRKFKYGGCDWKRFVDDEKDKPIIDLSDYDPEYYEIHFGELKIEGYHIDKLKENDGG